MMSFHSCKVKMQDATFTSFLGLHANHWQRSLKTFNLLLLTLLTRCWSLIQPVALQASTSSCSCYLHCLFVVQLVVLCGTVLSIHSMYSHHDSEIVWSKWFLHQWAVVVQFACSSAAKLHWCLGTMQLPKLWDMNTWLSFMISMTNQSVNRHLNSTLSSPH